MFWWLDKQDCRNIYKIFFVYILFAVLVSVPVYDLPLEMRVWQDGYPHIYQRFQTLLSLEHFYKGHFTLKVIYFCLYGYDLSQKPNLMQSWSFPLN